jgi:hypothetical protein
MTWIKAGLRAFAEYCQMWQIATTAPFDRNLELSVIDRDGVHALVFPCRRVVGGWVKSESGTPIDIHPTHWREWQVSRLGDASSPAGR